jgi:protease I
VECGLRPQVFESPKQSTVFMRPWYGMLLGRRSISAMSLKIAIVTGDAGEGYEALYAWHRFLEEGWEAHIVAPSRRRLHLVMHDFEPGWDTYVERPGYGLEAHRSIDEISADDYDALLVIGGRAPEYLRHNERLLRVIREMHGQGKPCWRSATASRC